MVVADPWSIRIQWGRARDGLHWLCHKVVRDPSSTLAAALPLCASLAVAVHPVRLAVVTALSAGSGPSRFSSATEVHGPRLPASVRPVSRT